MLSLLDFHQDQYNQRFQGEGFPDWSVQDDGLPPSRSSVSAPTTSGCRRSGTLRPLLGEQRRARGRRAQDRYRRRVGARRQRFAGNRDVLGYELMNEPWPGSVWSSCANTAGCPHSTPAVRRVLPPHDHGRSAPSDRRTLIWYEPQVIFNYGANTNLPRARRSRRLGFAFHDYCLQPTSSGPRAAATTSDDLGVHNALAHVAAPTTALLMTEFGATDQTPRV